MVLFDAHFTCRDMGLQPALTICPIQYPDVRHLEEFSCFDQLPVSGSLNWPVPLDRGIMDWHRS